MPTLQDLWYYFRKDGTLRTELMKKIDARMDEIAYEKNHLDAEALAEDRLFGTWTRKWKERIKNLKELKQHPFFYIEGLETPSAEIRHQERLEVESDIQDINQHRFDMSNIEIFLERASPNAPQVFQRFLEHRHYEKHSEYLEGLEVLALARQCHCLSTDCRSSSRCLTHTTSS